MPQTFGQDLAHAPCIVVALWVPTLRLVPGSHAETHAHGALYNVPAARWKIETCKGTVAKGSRRPTVNPGPDCTRSLAVATGPKWREERLCLCMIQSDSFKVPTAAPPKDASSLCRSMGDGWEYLELVLATFEVQPLGTRRTKVVLQWVWTGRHYRGNVRIFALPRDMFPHSMGAAEYRK